IFRWTVGNGTCSPSFDDVIITRYQTPSTASAGPDQSFCETSTATMVATAPAVGNGTWTLVSGTGTITTPSSPTSGIIALGYGANIFRWTVSNGTCSPSFDDVTITRYQTPSTPTASGGGPYCTGDTISLSTPTVTGGTYAWTGPGGFT